MPPRAIRHRLVAALLLAAGLGGCSQAPYPVDPVTTPPWETGAETALPVLEPPLSARAHRLYLCYGSAVNGEEEIASRAEELCQDGRLLVEHQNSFWNGCSLLQPVRVTYICDPPPPVSDYN